MTKKGPLSKAERFFIDNHLDKPIDDLCKDLDRAKSTINKYLKTLATEDQKKTETLLFQQFARNERGSTVMTQNAAEMADDMRGKANHTTKTKNCTTVIK